MLIPAVLAGAACSPPDAVAPPVVTAEPRPAAPAPPVPAPMAPRLVAPMTGASAYTDRPSFTVELAPGSQGAEVEICADRACEQIRGRLVASPSGGGLARAVPEQPLPSGRVFWRARNRPAGSGAAAEGASAVWQLAIVRGAPGVDTLAMTFRDPPLEKVLSQNGISGNARAWGTGDVDGDGHSDAVILACPGGEGCPAPRLTLLPGGPGRAPSTVPWPGEQGPPQSVIDVGDVDRDGHADVVLSDGNARKAWVLLGSAAGLGRPSPVTATNAITAQWGQGCDMNGDGFMDYVAVGGAPNHAAQIHLGGAAGLPAEPSLTFESGDHDFSSFGEALGFGDVDRDGLCDVVAGAYNGGPRRRGRVYVFLGGRSPATSAAQVIDEPDAVKKSKAHPHFGITVTVRDTDGDGAAEVYASTACYGDDQEKGLCTGGTVHEYRGGPGGVAVNSPRKVEAVPSAP